MFKTKGRARLFGLLFGCLLIALVVAPDFINCASCSGQNKDGQISETTLLFGTYCTIAFYPEEEHSAGQSRALLNEAFDMCRYYEKLLSMTVQGGDVWRINNAEGEAVTVDNLTAEIIKRGLEFGDISDGKFDITIGRLSKLWNIGNPDIRPRVPDSSDIAKAISSIDYRGVTILSGDSGSMAIQLENPDAWLDLGGIAKGYIADEIAAFLARNGIKNALIDMGGDIVVRGEKPNGTSWRLGIQHPDNDNELIGVLELRDVAVVSAGTYERNFETGGILYHHILDPKTGMPAQSDIIAATIIADDAVTGEGLSTTAVLAGSKEIQEICESTPGFIGAVLILSDFEIITFGNVELVE